MAEGSLLLVLSNSTGGIGTHVASVAALCSAAGWTVTVCGPAATERLFQFTGTGAEFVPLPVGLRMLGNGGHRRTLRSLIGTHDVTHAHGLQAGVVAGRLGGRNRTLTTWHNAPLSTGVRVLPHVLLERVAARRAAVTIGASEDLVVRARRAGAADARYVPVAPPALTPASADASTLRRRLGVGEAPVVLGVGRLHRQKRWDVLVAAAAGWQALDPRPVVLIAGDGPERQALVRKASGLEVRLLGRRSDVADLLSVADVVVLPSTWEARPLAAQEALAAGRALVTTAAGGTAALVGTAAVLVPVDNPSAITAAVLRLLGDPAARHELESRALARAGEWPDAPVVAGELMAIYAEKR